jgi:NADPH:quinone reductase-like Zn-dependent oxidoreductase
VLRERGADAVLVDGGGLAEQVRAAFPAGVDRVLELVGTTTLLDSLRCARRGGIVCVTGILGGQWSLPDFRPMEHIPTGVRLTSYSGESSDISREQLQAYVSQVERGQLRIPMGPVFPFAKLRDAHGAMDGGTANGKMVVVTD